MCIVCGPGGTHLLRAIAARNAPRPASRFEAQAVAPVVTPPLDPAARDGMDGPADVILRGGTVITMDPSCPEAEAVAVRAGRILAVGREAEVLAQRGRLTRLLDLQGGTLLPGFVNAHWHMPFTLLCAWYAVAGTIADTLARAVAETPPGEWIVLSGGGAGDLSATAHPAVLTRADGAILAGNALAGADGPLPAHVAGLLDRFAARLRPGIVRPRLARLLRESAAQGVTCLRVCGLGTLGGTDDLDLMRAAIERSQPVRLRATLDAALLAEWRDLHLPPGFGDDAFRVDTVSAWPDTAGGYPAELRAAAAEGWRVTLHADAGHDWPVLAGEGPQYGIELRAMPDAAQLYAVRTAGLSLGLPADQASADPGVPFSLGLDAAQGASSPLEMLHAATEAGLPLHAALEAVTINAARRCGAAEIIGSLTPGKYADFAFLSADPRHVPAAQLRCTGTWVNGLETFRA